MLCKNCGSQLPEGADFCANCGTKMAKKKSPLLILVPIVIVVVIAIIAFVLLLSGKKENAGGGIGSGNKGVSGKSSFIVDTFDKETIVYKLRSTFLNAKGETYQALLNATDNSGDFSKYIYDEVSSDQLFYITTDLEPILIADDVDYYDISYSGDYIAYVQRPDRSVGSDLYLYSTADGKTTYIDSNVKDIALSPNGDIVVYTGNYTDYETESECKLYIGGINIETKLIEDSFCTPITATNDGKMVFYADSDHFLSVYKDEENQLLSDDVDFDIWFNVDVTELLYVSDDCTYYLSSDMDEPKMVLDSEYEYFNTPYEKDYYKTGRYNNRYSSYIVNKDTLKESVFTARGLWWLNSSAEVVPIVKYSDYAYITEDGKSMVYMSNNEEYVNQVYIMEEINDKLVSRTVYEEDALEILASRDLSTIYIITRDELYVLKDGTKLEKIMDVEDAWMVKDRWTYSEITNKMYFLDDYENELYCVGTDSNSVEKIMDNVWSLYKELDTAYFGAEVDGVDYPFYITNEGFVELSY